VEIGAAARRQLIKLIVGRYVRRQRRKVAENPSVRERMNLRTGEMLLDAYRLRSKAMLSGFFFPAEMAHVYKMALSFTENLAAIIAGNEFGPRALQTAESLGYSRDGCSFHRATLGAGLDGNLPRFKLVVATSHLCDGQNKALEALADRWGVPYFLFDVPQEKTPEAVDYLAGQLAEIEDEMARITGRRAGPGDWAGIFRYSNESRALMLKVQELRKRRPCYLFGQRAFNLLFQSLLMLGTPFLRDCYKDLVAELEAAEAAAVDNGERFRIIWLLSYPYFRGNFLRWMEEELGVHAVAEELGNVFWSPLDPERPLRSLATKVLENPQLGPLENRVSLVERLVKDYAADGVLHYSHWGCRQGCGGVRPIADAVRRLGVPFLDLDGDCIDDRNYSEGQTRTRLEGFVELMGGKGGVKRGAAPKEDLYLGVDIGSLTAKAVVVDGGGEIVASELILTGAGSRRAAGRLRELIFDGGGLGGRIARCVATGYGRSAVDYADDVVTEITCHARGMARQVEGVRTVIDIGGQDTKAIAVDARGNVSRFLMNDKCAAGTGRFLEVMARALEVDIEEFGPRALEAASGVTISSMCTVFAESEVVSLIAEGLPVGEIVRGLCDSIAARTAALVDRVGREKKIAMSGGVAKNVGVVRALERALGTKLVIPPDPQIVGALGAALIASGKS
jgi:predicted CoA-substrate-specific enzyme activase